MPRLRLPRSDRLLRRCPYWTAAQIAAASDAELLARSGLTATALREQYGKDRDARASRLALVNIDWRVLRLETEADLLAIELSRRGLRR
jgi:hypothetical protein